MTILKDGEPSIDLRAEFRKLEQALVRAHCDLRWYEDANPKKSIALRENALLGFDVAWENGAK
jgi:hypothetical protein